MNTTPAVAVAAVVLLAALFVLPGCRPSPIPADGQRSPYERYDALRGQVVPKTVTDSFGREQPNLRGRLGNRE